MITDPDSFPRQARLLGRLRLSGPPGLLVVPGGKSATLLAYLLLHAGADHGREQLAELIWPGAPPERGRRNLSDALYKLRQALGEGWLATESDYIHLRAEELWLDYRAFEHLGRGDNPADWSQALELYSHDLLPEIYDDWVLSPRLALQELRLECLQKLATAALNDNDPGLAQTYCQQLIDANPLDEAAYRGLMRSLALLGRLPEAIDVYERLRQQLAQAMQLQPARQTQALAQQLQSEIAWRAAGHSAVLPPPFVGRVAERAQLAAQLQRARSGQGGLVVLLGDAGIGKSRLLEEVARSATWRGWQVGWGRGQELALPAPYAPLPQALARLLPPARLIQVEQLAAPHWLAIAARLLPELARRPALPEAPPELKPGQLAQALQRLLHALQEIAPHLLLLDDAHWADPALWPLLDQLRPLLAESAVLIVVSGRADSLRRQESAWPVIESWERAGVPLLFLSPLERTDLQALVMARQPDLTGAQLEQLWTASGGHPLLALSLLAAPDSEAELAGQASLAGLMQRQVAAVSVPAQIALQAAAVLGYQFDYRTWAQVVTAFPAAELPALAGELEQARLIVLAEEGYHFAHDTLRAHIYGRIAPVQRLRLHHNAFYALQANEPHKQLALLHHARQAQLKPQQARYAILAGEEALHTYTFAAAVDFFATALAVLTVTDSEERFRAVRGRLQALHLLGDREAQAADVAEMRALAQQSGNLKWQVEANRQAAELAWIRGDQAEAQALAEAGLTLARQVGDGRNEGAFLEALGRVARNQGDFHRAAHWVQQAYDCYRRHGDRGGEASAVDKLANLRLEMGEYAAAAEQHRQAAAIFAELGAVLYEARALSGLGLALRMMGSYDEARRTHEGILKLTIELGDVHGRWVQLVLLGNISLDLDDYETAAGRYQEALAFCGPLNDPRALSMTLYNLGECHREDGRLDEAKAYYDEALQVNRAKGFRRGEANALNGLGLLYLEQGEIETARRALYASRAIWQELGERIKLVETNAGLAVAARQAGALDEADRYLAEALATLDEPNDQLQLRAWVHYVAYVVRQAAGAAADALTHLRQAAAIIQELAGRRPLAQRGSIWQRGFLNQKVAQALAEHSRRSTRLLAQAEAPLGRKLSASERVPVTWTLYSPEDETWEEATERRRAVLQRLLAEAEAQAAVPTDDDLAAALNVSRRTIVRDMKALMAEGHELPTRRRSRS